MNGECHDRETNQVLPDAPPRLRPHCETLGFGVRINHGIESNKSSCSETGVP